MAIGGGFRTVAVLSTALILAVQVILGLVERRLFGRCLMREGEIAFDDDRGRTRKEIDKLLRLQQGQSVEASGLRRAGDHMILSLQYCTSIRCTRNSSGTSGKIEGVREVRLNT
jgi:hypothetical protein